MTATNHALTGAAIGLLIGQPVLALPIAFASHFICDALPHYGANDKVRLLKSRGFRHYLMVEAALCFLIVASLAYLHPMHWLLAAVCAFLAASPDLYWVGKYRAVLTSSQWRPNWFAKFAGGIQWFQRPIGAAVELAWFTAALVVLVPTLGVLVKS